VHVHGLRILAVIFSLDLYARTVSSGSLRCALVINFLSTLHDHLPQHIMPEAENRGVGSAHARGEA